MVMTANRTMLKGRMRCPQRQQGVALIMGLLVLVLVSAAGVATMESSGIQLKMASATEDRQQALEAAEIAMRVIEERMWANVDEIAETANMAYECQGDLCYKPDCSYGRCFQGLWLAGDSVTQCKIVDDGEYESVAASDDACASAFSEAKGGNGNSGNDNTGDTGDTGDSGGDSTCDSSKGNKNKSNSNSGVSVPPPVYNAWESGTDSDYLNVWDDANLHMTVDLPTHERAVKYIVEFLCFVPADPVADLSDSNRAPMFRITTRSQSDAGRAEVMLQTTFKRTL